MNLPARRRVLLAAAGLLALAPGLLRAQPARLPAIGYLLLNPLVEPPSRERQAFLDGLQQYGLVPGKTARIVYRSAENELEFLDGMANELVRQKVDLIVASGALAILAARKATKTLPIVMLAVGDPVGSGVVRSLARPEANVTGVSFLSSELSAKRVQLIKELVPRAGRMAVLSDPRNPNARAESAATIEAAQRLGMAVLEFTASSEGDLQQAIGRMRAQPPDVLYLAFEGTLIGFHRALLAKHALQMRIPIVSGWSGFTEAGGLLSYAPDIAALFRRAAYHVDRILRGARPADLPVEQPTNIELVLNARTAHALGIRIPQTLLLRADRVIE